LIIIIAVIDIEKCKQLAKTLQDKGFAVKAIFPPTVPERRQCLRVCIHAFNTIEEINLLIESMVNCLN
jgi:8-amino-7-oxononanoate synthase